MATFDGVDLGIVEEFTSAPAPKAFQKTAYPGVNGYERLDLGARGKVHKCSGVLAGVDMADLSSILQGLGAYVLDGGAYMLIDANGTSWALTIMTSFEPVGRRYLMGTYGEIGVAQRFRAEWETDL